METLSFWANRHPWPARLIIALAHVSAALLGITGGLLLYAKGIRIPLVCFYFLIAVYCLAHWACPARESHPLQRALTFRRRKSLEALLFGSLSLMWMLLGREMGKIRVEQQQKAGTGG